MVLSRIVQNRGPQAFWHQGPVSWSRTFPWTRIEVGVGGRFWNDSSTFHLLCTLFLFLLHQLHLRSSGIRFRRLGTPGLEQVLMGCVCVCVCVVLVDTESKMLDVYLSALLTFFSVLAYLLLLPSFLLSVGFYTRHGRAHPAWSLFSQIRESM